MSSLIPNKENAVKGKGFACRPKTAAQNKKIWALKSELCLSEELLRDVVESVTKQRSISGLSCEQAMQIINRLQRHSRRRFRKPRAGKNVILMATPKQRTMINVMAGKIQWKYSDGFQRFLKARFKGMSAIKTNKDVTRVRKALDNIIMCQNKSAQGAG